MPVYFDKAKNRWRFSFNRIIDGRRTRATKLLPAGWSRTQAEKYDRAETGRLYGIASGVERPEPTIGQAVALYLDHRVPQMRGRTAVRDLAYLVDYIEGRPMSELPEAAREYRRDNPNLAPATLRNRLSYLKSACRYAWKKHGLTEHDPTGRMELPTVNNARIVHTTVRDLEQLLAGIEDDEARACFTLAFYTGSRWISEIHCRQPEDVVRDGRDVMLKVGMTKNGTPRLVPVSPAARWTLKYLPFTRSPETLYDRFIAAREAVGLPELRAHDMRHVLGGDIIRRTGSIRDVMDALHHKAVQSANRYAAIQTDRVRRVLAGVGQARKMHTTGKVAARKKAA